MRLSDDTFITQFEDHSLDLIHFNHQGHLRLAWLYLKQFPLLQAVEKVTKGISSYAQSLGADDKFQHTLTEAIVRIMACRMQDTDSTLDTFLQRNQDLVNDIQGVVGLYYSSERLHTPEAKSTFISPDLRPLGSP